MTISSTCAALRAPRSTCPPMTAYDGVMAPRKRMTNGHTPTHGARWVLFMPTIPAKPASVRVKIWRRLQAVGAVGLRGSVYALPNREECVEVFEWVSRELDGLGGQASICEGRFLDASTDDDIERRFIDARNADYAEIAAAARQLARKLEARRIAPARIAAFTDEHAKLVRRFDE